MRLAQGQSEKAKKDIAAFLETCIGKPMPDSMTIRPLALMLAET